MNLGNVAFLLIPVLILAFTIWWGYTTPKEEQP